MKTFALALAVALTFATIAAAGNAYQEQAGSEWIDVFSWPNEDGYIYIQATVTANYIPRGPVTAWVDGSDGSGPVVYGSPAVTRCRRGTSRRMQPASEPLQIETLYMLLGKTREPGPVAFTVTVPFRGGVSVIKGSITLDIGKLTEGTVTASYVR